MKSEKNWKFNSTTYWTKDLLVRRNPVSRRKNQEFLIKSCFDEYYGIFIYFRWYHLKRKRLALLLAQLRKVDIFRCICYLRE